MYLTGFADEAAKDINGQIQATKELGWKYIESRNIDGRNIHDIPQEMFDAVCEKLDAAGVRINCFGSAIANWASKLSDPDTVCCDQLRRAIPRMHTLGTKLIRVMSFNVPENDCRLDNKAVTVEVIRRMKTLAKIAEDAAVTLVHENCNTWGGRSWEHTLRMLDSVRSPALKLVFDTGNPVEEKDVRGEGPYHFQDPFEYYRKVKDHVIYVHIKDGKIVDGKIQWTFFGDGDGKVQEILADLHARGYDGGLSIEPHLAVVAHDPSVQSSERIMYDNYIEYGRRIEKMLTSIGWRPPEKC